MIVYHGTVEHLSNKILEEGLKPQPDKNYVKNIQVLENKYLPEKDISKTYAFGVINNILNKHRPPGFPERRKSIFFHTSRKDLPTDIVFKVDLEKAEDILPIYQVPYEIASDIFFTSMKRITLNESLDKEIMDNKAKYYWENVEKIKEIDRIKKEPSQELFIRTNQISPKCLEIINNTS